ncbi:MULTISPECIES: HTTM domain-containing protein [Halobacterium]|uniref:HTTM domain-containing protein n=1 Tax=Halobacterium TaxID=2239 RepID=UPI00196421F4|nr:MULTISPECIES: HTTM domain-containing protein [Halobacterium]MDL0121629.1 HTTM domain-containing protein [Halobacterium salinarum]QRY25431.1 HTTM domain-containing protein [Halobacterium sp. BOL4-2]
MRFRAAVASRLGVDTRSLAAFRVGLAVVVLVDLALRLQSLTAFYTDSGVLPRAVMRAQYPVVSRASLHMLSGAAWAQAALFAVTAVAAVALLVGYRSTAATFATGVLVVSMHARNPLVLNGGDLVLQMLFVWALGLPLGERWSVDAVDRGAWRDRVVSVATVGVLCQLVIVYTSNAVLKLRGDAWVSGTAVRTVFSLEMFVVGLGHVLSETPRLLVAFDRVWLVLLAGSVCLVVLTGWWRAAAAAAFAGMHLGMAATMQLGVFPLVAVVGLVPFVPGCVWEAAAAARPQRTVHPVRWIADQRERAPSVPVPSLPRSVRARARTAVTGVFVVLLVGQAAYTVVSVGGVETPVSVGPLDAGDAPPPRWYMFAPEPLSVDHWVKAPATTPGGGRIGAFAGGAFSWGKPPDVSAQYPSARWRKYVVNIADSDSHAVRAGLVAYLCRRSAAGTPHRGVTNVTVYDVRQPTRLGGSEPTHRRRIGAADCPVNAAERV